MTTKGKIQIEIKAKDDASAQMAKIGKSAEALGKKFKTMGKVMVATGIAIAGALTASVVAYAKAGDEVAKMAKRTGLAVEMLSELRHVAGLTGTDLGSIEKATKKMAKTIVDASEGMTTYIRAFDRIGLSAEKLILLSPEEQFWTIAEALSAIENAGIKSATAVEIFGRAGTMLIPMLDMTAEELAAARQEAHDLGVVFDDEASVAAENFTDALLVLKTSMTGVMFTIAEELMPEITRFIKWVSEAVVTVKDWIAVNPQLVTALKILIPVLIGGGGLLLAFSQISKAIIAINVALAIMHGMMGPAGWIKLAAGLAIAGGAIYGMQQLMKTPEVPSMQKGGIVPGPIGAPIPVIAHGGEQFAGVGKSFGDVHVHIGNFMGDESSLRAFTRKVKEIMGQDTRRTSFSGINRLEYFPGSSSV